MFRFVYNAVAASTRTTRALLLSSGGVTLASGATAKSASEDTEAKALAHAKGKSCRVCSDQPSTLSAMMDLYKAMDAAAANPRPASAAQAAASKSAAAPTASQSSATPADAEGEEEDGEYVPPTVSSSGERCPATYKELGNATWLYLHTMAAYYPEQAPARLRDAMPGFLRTFASVYPCETCREHMHAYIDAHPPQAADNRALSVWVCGLHNDVNRVLGKGEVVRCDADTLLRLYRDGPADGSCD